MWRLIRDFEPKGAIWLSLKQDWFSKDDGDRDEPDAAVNIRLKGQENCGKVLISFAFSVSSCYFGDQMD